MLGIGNFLVVIITFIIVAFVIFVTVKLTKKWGIQWHLTPLLFMWILPSMCRNLHV
ncbi:hypothetical protein KEJ37_02845 [Candidatus Bathyarchaeota archaeon]|nr:hypothetical protein [Candidatus Bathyarchaeota archaeon]